MVRHKAGYVTGREGSSWNLTKPDLVLSGDRPHLFMMDFLFCMFVHIYFYEFQVEFVLYIFIKGPQLSSKIQKKISKTVCSS